MSPDQPNDTLELSGVDALIDACNRNVPVEVFRVSRSVPGPPARGRLLSISDKEVVIERLQMIGEEFPHGVGTLFACYFNVGGELFTFQTRVTETRSAARLNGRLVVPAVKLARPAKVSPGQRRNVYRVSVGGRADAPRVEIWLSDPYLPRPERKEIPVADVPASDTAEDNATTQDAVGSPAPHPAEADPPPARLEAPRPREFSGRMADGSDLGLGVTVFDCPYTRLRIRGPIWIRCTLPDDATPLEFEGTICHTSPVREIDTRVGIQLRDDGGAPFSQKVRRLVAYLTTVQREQRRN